MIHRTNADQLQIMHPPAADGANEGGGLPLGISPFGGAGAAPLLVGTSTVPSIIASPSTDNFCEENRDPSSSCSDDEEEQEGKHGDQCPFDYTNLYVTGVPLDWTEKMLLDSFSAFGKISSAKLMLCIHTGKSRGFAFVMFQHVADAQTAMTEAPKKFQGGMTVKYAKKNAGSTVGAATKKVFLRNLPRNVTREMIKEAIVAAMKLEDSQFSDDDEEEEEDAVGKKTMNESKKTTSKKKCTLSYSIKRISIREDPLGLKNNKRGGGGSKHHNQQRQPPSGIGAVGAPAGLSVMQGPTSNTLISGNSHSSSSVVGSSCTTPQQVSLAMPPSMSGFVAIATPSSGTATPLMLGLPPTATPATSATAATTSPMQSSPSSTPGTPSISASSPAGSLDPAGNSSSSGGVLMVAHVVTDSPESATQIAASLHQTIPWPSLCSTPLISKVVTSQQLLQKKSGGEKKFHQTIAEECKKRSSETLRQVAPASFISPASTTPPPPNPIVQGHVNHPTSVSPTFGNNNNHLSPSVPPPPAPIVGPHHQPPQQQQPMVVMTQKQALDLIQSGQQQQQPMVAVPLELLQQQQQQQNQQQLLQQQQQQQQSPIFMAPNTTTVPPPPPVNSTPGSAPPPLFAPIGLHQMQQQPQQQQPLIMMPQVQQTQQQQQIFAPPQQQQFPHQQQMLLHQQPHYQQPQRSQQLQQGMFVLQPQQQQQ